MRTKFSGLKFLLPFFIIIHVVFRHKKSSQPFSLRSLGLPSSNLLTAQELCRTVNILPDSFIEAVMMATQRKESPLDKMAAWHSAALINIKTLHVATCSYYSYRIERTRALLLRFWKWLKKGNKLVYLKILKNLLL